MNTFVIRRSSLAVLFFSDHDFIKNMFNRTEGRCVCVCAYVHDELDIELIDSELVTPTATTTTTTSLRIFIYTCGNFAIVFLSAHAAYKMDNIIYSTFSCHYYHHILFVLLLFLSTSCAAFFRRFYKCHFQKTEPTANNDNDSYTGDVAIAFLKNTHR